MFLCTCSRHTHTFRALLNMIAYRPRPGRRQDVNDPDDIQRFYNVMLPISRHAPVRLMTMATLKAHAGQGRALLGSRP